MRITSGTTASSTAEKLTYVHIRLKFGECFFRVNVDTCREYIESNTEEIKQGAKGIEDKLDESKKKMNKLKSVLYSKFGNSINLEEE